jgi:CRP/FNR family cyclic AMP-dependent transcriptional regulator
MTCGEKDFIVESEVDEKTCLVMKNELSLFPFLEEKDLAEVPCFFHRRQVKAGELLYSEGDPCDYLAYIIEGSLEIKKQTEFADKKFILGIYGEGSLVGELCILDQVPRVVTAVAKEDTTLVVLTKENFEKMLSDCPELGVKFLRGLLLAVSIRLRKNFDRMASIF